jgi:phage-related protein
MVREFVYYETAAGNRPVEKFLNDLPSDVRDEVFTVMRYIEDTEQPPQHLFCKMKNTNNLWEVRVRFDGNIYRVLCFFDSGKIIIAANGFQKKQQKAPKQEIDTAHKRQKDYFRRK